MPQKIDVDLFACIDAAGDYAIGKDEDSAREAYENDVGALSDCSGFRMVRVTIAVTLPEPAELRGEAPDGGAAALKSVT